MADAYEIAKKVKKLKDEDNFNKEAYDIDEQSKTEFEDFLEAEVPESVKAADAVSIPGVESEPVNPNVEQVEGDFLVEKGLEAPQTQDASLVPQTAPKQQAAQIEPAPQVQPQTAPVEQPAQQESMLTPEEQQKVDQIMAREDSLESERELQALEKANTEEWELKKKTDKYQEGIDTARENVKGANVFQSGTVLQKILAGLSLFAGALGGKGAETMAIFKANENAIINQNQDLIDKYTAQLGDVNKAKIAIRKDYYDTMEKILAEKIELASPAARLKLEQLQADLVMKNIKINEYVRGKVAQEPISKGQEAMDKTFGQEYAKFLSGGKIAGQVKNLAAVKRAMKGLKSSDFITGPIISLVPEFVRKRIPGLRKGIQVQQLVESVVQQSLKETLGGQFTEREGEKLVQRAFDPTQPEEENIKRTRILLNSVENMINSKMKASRYFKQHGTLRGYPGELDFEGMILRENTINPVGFEED